MHRFQRSTWNYFFWQWTVIYKKKKMKRMRESKHVCMWRTCTYVAVAACAPWPAASMSPIVPSLGLVLRTDVFSPLLPTIHPPHRHTGCPLLGTNLRLELKHNWESWIMNFFFFFFFHRQHRQCPVNLMHCLHCIFIKGPFSVELSLWCTYGWERVGGPGRCVQCLT